MLDALWPIAFRNFTRNICPTKGTGQWIGGRPEFQAWENCEIRKLWIHGQPAAGKTYLAKHIINRMGSRSGVQVLECFLSARCIGRNTCKAILRSTLYRLFERNPTTLTRLPAISPDTEWKLEQLTNLWTNVMVEALDRDVMVEALNRKQNIVLAIDGFDEISHQEQEDFLDCLESCEDKLSPQFRRNIRIIILSRWCESLQQPKREFSAYKMTERDTTEDIRCTVTKEVERFAEKARYSKRFEKEVCDHITNGAKGVYLWATIMVSDIGIRMPRQHQLEAQLQRLPRSLAELYDFILDRINSDLHELTAKRVLLWVVFSLEPLKLKELNLAIALAEVWERDPNGPVDSKTLDLCMIEPHVFKAALVRLCGQLLRLSANNHVEPVHRTLSQYLTTNPQALAKTNWVVPNHARFYMDKVKSHAALGRMCAGYLMMDSFKSAGEPFDASPERQARWEIKVQTRIGDHDLAQYSALCWSRHLALADLVPGVGGGNDPNTVALGDPESEFAISWLEVWWFVKEWRASNFPSRGCHVDLRRAIANDGHINTLIPQIADDGTADLAGDNTPYPPQSTDGLCEAEEEVEERPPRAPTPSQTSRQRGLGTSTPGSASGTSRDWPRAPLEQRGGDVRNTNFHLTTVNNVNFIYNG